MPGEWPRRPAELEREQQRLARMDNEPVRERDQGTSAKTAPSLPMLR
jgi:hypothetical protein